MVSEAVHQEQRNTHSKVLILVLVEDGLRESLFYLNNVLKNVLILVLVEDGLREDKQHLECGCL